MAALATERWSQADLCAVKDKYRELLHVLLNHTRYLAYISELVAPTEIDAFAACVVHILSVIGPNRVLPAIKTMVEQEFLSNLQQPQTIMRGNCAASKIQTLFCRREGREYLQFVLGDFLRTVIVETQSSGLDFTIDPQKVSAAAVKANLAALQHYATLLLERLLDVDVREQMPRSIRAIAALTAELCRAHYPEGLSVLVGGFVNLRYFSPAICVPWSYGLLARMPSDKARRNLVMLGKVLQSISNGFVNSKKEPYLLQVEELVKTYVPRMVDYLAALAFDPAAPPRASPGLAPSAIEPRTSRRRINVAARSSDEPTLAAPAAPSTWSPQRPKLARQESASLSSGTSTSGGAEPWADLFTVPPVSAHEIDLFAFDLDELWTLHRVVHQVKRKLIAKLSQDALAAGTSLTQSAHAVPTRAAAVPPSALASAPPRSPPSSSPRPQSSTPPPSRGNSQRQLVLGAHVVAAQAQAQAQQAGGLSPRVHAAPFVPAERRAAPFALPPLPPPPAPAPTPTQTQTNPATNKLLISVLSSLGPPPPAVHRTAKSETVDSEGDYLSLSAVSAAELEGVTPQQAQHYASLNFFYAGKPNKQGQPVFYLIANRVTESLLDTELRAVVVYVSSEIKRVIGDRGLSPYAIVIDTSWTHFGSKFILSILNKFREIVEYSLRKRLAHVYLVHPTPLVSQMLPVLKNLFPAWQKAVICYQWNVLEEHIAPANIMLPNETQGFITKAFFVTKVNAKGKHQLRLVKFTSNSLLNIDPKSRSLQNEKLLSDIECITLPAPEELLITFSEKASSKPGKKKLFGPNSGEARERHYICKSRQERDQIMEELFRICFYQDTLKWPLEYQVVKVEGGLKANLTLGQTVRTYKVTLDSLLILDNNSIKKELPLVGLKSIALGLVGDQPIALRLEFHEGLGHRGRTKIIVCRSSELARALKQLLEHQAKIAHLNLTLDR